eukprot:CAMPEP_0172535786 /NCGR_PEP_ID=MMETSP1067-20121228/7632_1 /TAXON_ID=265564 ORGANISM="Thalassiosira punctigera, Strain Tpunct2005C2" /NCGR_SAMPLE_ID=MMETSP1067 /ASSEMBLY_ACC=CAM_ASM_000444 /LENGTH=687 /DNA_ID=CAMNT_0013320731 /DNA_START=265 /DNA_END=2328 /DNA_ORIENTATION=-
MADSNSEKVVKKSVSIDAPADAPTRRKLSPKRSMGPKQQSLAAFTPDNYSDDEDDNFFHEDAQIAAVQYASKSSSSDSRQSPPGKGWTNGQITPQFTPAVTLHPHTREGRLALYNHHRRWINFQSSWSRIGKGSTEMDAVHSESAGGESVMTGCLMEEARTVRALVAQLCECFYKAGWATGTGGGVSIRVGGPKENRPYRVFVAPSGVQKEDMVGDDVFELNMDRDVVVPPKTPNMRMSACTPLWYVVYRHVKSAMCVIHTHSMHAQLATLLDPTEKSDCLRVTHLEMLKGVGNHSYDSLLEIPIIDNRPSEDQLADQLEAAIVKYPKCNAVLVRRHGVYVWGDSWEQAKAQCESFDYLFESAVKMKGMGLESGLLPKSGTYHVKDEHMVDSEDAGEEKKEDGSPPAKRRKVDPAFNAAGAVNNDADLECTGTTIPLLPRDSKILLLDIEGTTTSISFVKDTLFPYVLSNLGTYINSVESEDLVKLQEALESDLAGLPDLHPANVQVAKTKSELNCAKAFVTCYVRALMANDVKATGLKSMQGKMWKAGYASGELVGHLYSDFVPALKWCESNGVKVCIYSSGSIGAQKLLFGHTPEGDLTSYFGMHFDTTTGSKRETASYGNIAEALGAKPGEVVFVSDLEAEIHAAKEAGMVAVVAARPGNAPLREDTKGKFPVVRSLLQLCGAD